MRENSTQCLSLAFVLTYTHMNMPTNTFVPKPYTHIIIYICIHMIWIYIYPYHTHVCIQILGKKGRNKRVMVRIWITKAPVCLFAMFSIWTQHQVGVATTCVEEVGGEFAGINFLHAFCRSWGWNSGHQAWCLVLLPAELSCWLLMFYSSGMQFWWDTILH